MIRAASPEPVRSLSDQCYREQRRRPWWRHLDSVNMYLYQHVRIFNTCWPREAPPPRRSSVWLRKAWPRLYQPQPGRHGRNRTRSGQHRTRDHLKRARASSATAAPTANAEAAAAARSSPSQSSLHQCVGPATAGACCRRSPAGTAAPRPLAPATRRAGRRQPRGRRRRPEPEGSEIAARRCAAGEPGGFRRALAAARRAELTARLCG
jgi:hypothetical protein